MRYHAFFGVGNSGYVSGGFIPYRLTDSDGVTIAHKAKGITTQSKNQYVIHTKINENEYIITPVAPNLGGVYKKFLVSEKSPLFNLRLLFGINHQDRFVDTASKIERSISAFFNSYTKGFIS